jgi:hypothetical protein
MGDRCGGDVVGLELFVGQAGEGRDMMSTHASVLVDSVGPLSAEVCRAAASFP